MVRLAAVSDVVVSGSNAANVVRTAELCRNRTISHARPSPTPTHHFTAQDRTAPPESTVTSMAHPCRAALNTGSAIAAAAACPSQDGCPPQTMSLAFAPTDELVMSRKCTFDLPAAAWYWQRPRCSCSTSDSCPRKQGRTPEARRLGRALRRR